MNIMISQRRLLSATLGALGLLSVLAISLLLWRSSPTPALAQLSCPPQLRADHARALSCTLELEEPVGQSRAQLWRVFEPDAHRADEGTYSRTLLVLKDDKLRFRAQVEHVVVGAQDQDMTPGALSTQALSTALGAPTMLLTNQESGSGGYLNMFLIVDTPAQVKVHQLEGTRNLEAKLVDGQLRFEDWDAKWGELEPDYRPIKGQAPMVTRTLVASQLKAAAHHMRTATPTMRQLQALAQRADVDNLNQQLAALIYAGHREIAWDYLVWVGPKLGLNALQIKQRRLEIERVLTKSEHSALIAQLQGKEESPFLTECAPYRRFKRALELVDQQRLMQAQLELEQLAHEPMPCDCQLKTPYSDDEMGHALYESAGQLGLQLTMVLDPGARERLSALAHRVNMPPSAARDVLDVYIDYPTFGEQQRCEHMLKKLGPGSDELIALSMPGLGIWRDEPQRWLCPTMVVRR